MANPKILEKKKLVIDEIAAKLKEAKSVIFFDNTGLSVSETMELRRVLKEIDAELKVYKNTLVKKAFDSLKIEIGDILNGPKVVAFGTDEIAPVKALSEFSKKHPNLELKVGYIDGNVTDKVTLESLAATPNKDTLLTMFAAGLLEHLKNVSICLDLHSKNIN